MSASHIIQAGNDQFIGKREAYIMNREEEGDIAAQKGRECACLTCS